MYDKNKILYDLVSLNYDYGRHTGFYESCEDNDYKILMSKDMLSMMSLYAEHYNVAYDNDFGQSFPSDWEYHDIRDAYEDMNYELYITLCNKMKDIILEL